MNDCKTVTLRTRPLKNRMLSFYLESYESVFAIDYQRYKKISVQK